MEIFFSKVRAFGNLFFLVSFFHIFREAERVRRRKKHDGRPTTVLNDGTVIRVRREVSTSEEEEEEEEEEDYESESKLSEAEESEKSEVELEEEPEDPLDIEERQLNNQLMLSLTLTLVDEENIRQRLLEIKKTKLRQSQKTLENNLVEKFTQDADVTLALFENDQNAGTKLEEEKVLIQR